MKILFNLKSCLGSFAWEIIVDCREQTLGNILVSHSESQHGEFKKA